MSADTKKKLIEKHKKKNPLYWFLDCLGLSSREWYHAYERDESGDLVWKHRIEDILFEYPRYGYRRIRPELKRRGYLIGKHKLQRILNKYNLKQKRKRYTHHTTDSRHRLPTYPNLIKDIVPSYPNHIWAADITYVHLPHGFCYVAMIIDVFTRKVVGWAIMETMAVELVIEALEMALEARGAPDFHHSDRGSQYCAKEYTAILKEHHVEISMAAKGKSVDNPHAESFFRTLKVEEVYISEYNDFTEAKHSIKHFIEIVYNQKRLHSSLGYVPPEEFENEWEKRQKGQKQVEIINT